MGKRSVLSVAQRREAVLSLIRREEPAGKLARRFGVSEQTLHRWRNQYGGMKAEEAKRLKQLEQENSRLKKGVAELTLDKDILQEAMKGNW